jgi:hypothetical protein
MSGLVFFFLAVTIYPAQLYAEILAPDESDLLTFDSTSERINGQPAFSLGTKISVSLGQGRAKFPSGPPSFGRTETTFRSTSFALHFARDPQWNLNIPGFFVTSEVNSSFSTSGRRLDTQVVSWVDLGFKMGAEWERVVRESVRLRWAALSALNYERIQYPMGTVAFQMLPLGGHLRLAREAGLLGNRVDLSAIAEAHISIFGSSVAKYPQRALGLKANANILELKRSGDLFGSDLRFALGIGFSSAKSSPTVNDKQYPHLLSLGWNQKRRTSDGFILESTSEGVLLSQESYVAQLRGWTLTWSELL